MSDKEKINESELKKEAKKRGTTRKPSSKYEKTKKILDNPKTSPADVKLKGLKGIKILNHLQNVKISKSIDSALKFKAKDSKTNEAKSEKISIHQIVPILAPRDAVGNEVLTIRDTLRESGYDSEIFVETVHPEMSAECKNYFSNKNNLNADLLIYHHAIGSKLADELLSSSSKLVLFYHNITPEKYFEGVNDDIIKSIQIGREQLRKLKERTILAISHSQFSSAELKNLGYSKIITIPFLIDFEIYKGHQNEKLIKKFGKSVNILFVGRVVPHKRIENLLKVFAYYNFCINPNSNLLLVGNYVGSEKYYQWLRDIEKKSQLPNVHFITKSDNMDLATYYQLAHVFVTMSEHEGFGVPLLESMHFGVPIIAYKSSAIPETLGNSGIMIQNEEPEEVAEIIDIIKNDQKLKEEIIEKQKLQLKTFDFEKTRNELVRNLQMLLE